MCISPPQLGGGAGPVTICRFQLAIDPPLAARSSWTYRLHVPFGLVPSKTDSDAMPVGTGAGAGNGSMLPLLKGWNVPDTSGPESGSGAAASSSRTRLTSTASAVPPASDIAVTRCPCGPTSRMSTSSGLRWPTPLRTRFTSVTRSPLGSPEIAHVDG
jgi:hypothetical protein